MSFLIPASSDTTSISHLGINPKFPLTLTTGKLILNPIGLLCVARSATLDIQALIFEVGESFIEKSEENFYMNLLM